MDLKNPYESPGTFKLHRLEYTVFFAATIVLMLIHFTDIRWPVAIGMFLYIDLIGYIPGAVAFRRSRDGRIHRTYYVLYNVMHSLIVQAAVVCLWMWLVRPEWALLAIAFHLFGDRGPFGNFYKTFGRPFEPVANPAFDAVVAGLRRRAVGNRLPAPDAEEDRPAGTRSVGAPA